MRLIDVILPLAISDSYTYEIPADIEYPQIGMRVLVPLGKKQVTGIVYRHRTEPVADTSIQIRPILAILDATPIVTPNQLWLWEWISQYYLCTMGEVMAAALPAGIIDDNYKARTVTYMDWEQGMTYDQALTLIQRSPKQRTMLQYFVEHYQPNKGVERRELIEGSGESPAILRALVEKHILQEVKSSVSRLIPYQGTIKPAFALNDKQQRAYQHIIAAWTQHNTVLLHGVTSSGKTEIYIHLIQEQLAQGKQVLYLVPEIALTTQLTERLRCIFGDQLYVYHSRFSSDERVEIYNEIKNNIDGQTPKAKLILGARSSVFLPFQSLGLIIVDEEHDSSYKQQDGTPRYHARSVAIMMGHHYHCHVLLGTATPSIESYYNAYQEHKYGLVTLAERHAGIQLPTIQCIDLKRQYHRKEMYDHFSDPLVERIREVLEKGKQVILFRNRRGYSSYIQCSKCGQVLKCVNCDVSLTLHKHRFIQIGEEQLTCHYCGHTQTKPSQCPTCGGEWKEIGFGTERIEDELYTLFPKARVGRMDLDTTRNKNAHQDLINQFAQHQLDILIGTQMVTKGLDFDNVSLVAVLNADSLLNTPDFRSHETAFQMLEQVAGRAGRRGERGEVIIQTFMPDHPIFAFLSQHDYVGLYQHQIAERQLFHYPPFYRLIDITLKHRNNDRLLAASTLLQERLQQVFGHRCSPIIIPSVARMHNTYLRHILLRIEGHADIQRAKQLLMESIHYVQSLRNCLGTIIIPDVDPM